MKVWVWLATPSIILGLTGVIIGGFNFDFPGVVVGLSLGLILSLAWLVFCLIRNNWTYKARMAAIIDGSLEEYNRLPDYDTMMMRWWVWDVEKFKK